MKSAVPLILCFSALSVAAYDFGKPDIDAIPVSLVQLLSRPEAFVGRKVRVMGVLSWHPDDGALLFLSREHYNAADIASSIDLPIKDELLPAPGKDVEKVNGSIVSVEGVVVIWGSVNKRVAIRPVTRILECVRASTHRADTPPKTPPN